MSPAELVLQPNPAQNAFTLNFPQQIGPAYLHLLDMAGRRMVFPYKVVPGERVDISALPSGLYTVRLVMDGRTISRLVVVR